MVVTAWAVQCKDLDDLGLLEQLKSRLVGYAEPQRASRYRNTSDAMRFALGRALLRSLIIYALPEQQDQPSAHWNDLLLDESANGSKPCLASAVKPQLDHIADFNISHDGKWVLAAVVSDGIVGVDVAHVYCPGRMTDVEYISEFSQQLSPEEMEYLCRHSQQRIFDFYTIWTAKEAYVKAIGIGIAITDLTSISVNLPKAHKGSLYVTVNSQPCSLKIVTGSLEGGSYIYALAKPISAELKLKEVSIQEILDQQQHC